MRAKTSIRKSLGIGLTVGVTLFWLVGVTASWWTVHEEMHEASDRVLRQYAEHILPLAILNIENQQGEGNPSLYLESQDGDENLVYWVRDDQDNILLRSSNIDSEVFSVSPPLGFSSTPTYRIYSTSALNSHIYIEVAESLEHRQEDLMEVGMALLMPLLLLIPISLLGVWGIIHLSLRKVTIFQHSIERRGAGDLSPVDTARLPEEFKPTAVAVNRLLERLRRALEAERSFTANSAHELRTPLATALAKVQRLKTLVQDGQLKKQTIDIETSLQSLSKQSEKLLELAKAEGGGAISQTHHNLKPILAMIVGDFKHQVIDGIRLNLPEGDVNSLLDPDAFAILARNLIENGLKHGRENQPLEVTLLKDGTLRVVNGCEPVPPEDLSQLHNRFVRSKTLASGSGLGLAIVDAITTGAGIDLHLRSPATGRSDGFEVELNLHPRADKTT